MTDSPEPSRPAHTPLATRLRLAAMMFLQYMSLGLWGVTVGTYIAANTGQAGLGIFTPGFIGYSTSAGAIGSLVSPLLLGYLSDRYFSAQWLLSLMHALCCVAALGMAWCESQTAFYLWLLLYFHCFLPACALTNKIALKHLVDSEAEYPHIRIFSTLGWITAGLLVGFGWPEITGSSIEDTATPIILGAIASGVMALYSLTLPPTPPEPKPGGSALPRFAGSLPLLTNLPLMVFLGITVLACIPTMPYNNYGNLFLNKHDFPHPAALMTLGQLSDLFCLWASPWLIARLGLRRLFSLGLVAWFVRYVLLAVGGYYQLSWAVYSAILIHGACYVFIYVVAVMYVDRLTDSAHRGAAQGLLAIATSGVGNLLGALAVGYTESTYLTPPGITPPPYDWTAFWLVPAGISLFTLAVYYFVFLPMNRRAGSVAKEASM
ncbi:Putative nucleoside transporter YegT [Durusdinium trenchii]|uniref:Nucleoside transporter YegT n=1 Tax=Durusdinium trenchii TaxID=1381693 RepID=A0ABP0LEA0_9DINO